MSLILDALKKAEHERKGDEEAPSFNAEHARAERSSNARPYIWLILTCAVLVTLIFVTVSFIHSKDKKPSGISQAESNLKTKQAQPTTSYQRAITGAPKVQQAQAPSQSKQDSKTLTSSNNGTKKESPEQSIKKQNSLKKQKALIHAQYKKDEKSSDHSINSAISDLYKKEKPTQKNNTIEQEKTQANNEKQPTIDNSRHTLEAYNSVKSIKELPFSIQDGIPTLMYQKHTYKRNNGRSTIVINGKPLHEGANISSGIRITKILEDGIILKQKDREFKMQALNSWINF